MAPTAATRTAATTSTATTASSLHPHSLLNFWTSTNNPTNTNMEEQLESLALLPHRQVYTRALYRICLKFTTSEDEDEGKPEPSTAYWTVFGKPTTVGNAGPQSATPDAICRRMDDSMSGPAAGSLVFLLDAPANTAVTTSTNPQQLPSALSSQDSQSMIQHALEAGLTCGWTIAGARGDAAVRVGNAKVLAVPGGKQAQILSLNAERWRLCPEASFAAGNSVFTVAASPASTNNATTKAAAQQKITIHCTKGPMRGKLFDIHASRCPFVFGRAHEADLCIMDRELSRKHGAILYLPANNNSNKNARSNNNNNIGCFVLVDLESTNGSYMRLVGPYGVPGIGALAIGDEFIVGRTGFSVNRFDYGISEAIGARPTMEDRTCVIQSLMLEPSHGYYKGEPKEHLEELAMSTFAAVFDGHGGDECSNYLVEALPKNVRQALLAERQALKAAVDQARQNATATRPDQPEDAASELVRKILKASYLKTDRDFITPKNSPQSGSTGATILLLGRRLFAANVGDSRVVLCRGGGQCVELTSDHKPSRPDEAARVRAAGGFILNKRVMGELAITRAFGDKSFKFGIKAMLAEEAEELANAANPDQTGGPKDLTAPLVTAEPEIASMILSHNDEFLLLACDGLFDVFRSQDAIALARQELIAHRGEPAEVARILSDQAIRVRRSRDNVSILIIVLRPFWELS